MSKSATIPGKPDLRSSEEYAALRKEGVDLIEQLASALWTDYNIHDPGITLLELLCYAETEIGYKLGFSIQDLLAPLPGTSYDTDLQAFYTARNILTCNPWTPDDFRKLLIDREGVKNAWLHCKECTCGIPLYANCQKDRLQYTTTDHRVRIRGFNDTLVELDSDPLLGDLNSGKIFANLVFTSAGRMTKANVETRFPPWHAAEAAIAPFAALMGKESTIFSVTARSIAASKEQTADVPADELYRSLRKSLYAVLEITFHPAPSDPPETFVLRDVPVKVWYRSDTDRKAVTLSDLKALLQDTSPGGIVPRYLAQLREADDVINDVTITLHAHRNLAEDYCNIGTVPVEDVAICADITMEADTDIEEVLGQAYWEIGQYFNPSVPMYSLQEMLDMGMVTEDIFNGPALDHGFIRNQDLDASTMRTTLYASDVINILMDIAGITKVSNFTLARYDADGTLVESQPWELDVSPGHLPRLYTHASKVLAFKNELPFLPDADELNDALQLQRGHSGTNKFKQVQNDFGVPGGTWTDNEMMEALQDSLPETYGVGRHGLPEPSSNARKGQAEQLRGYLLVFEHLLSVYLQQLQHFRKLFSNDPAIAQTYFPVLLDDAVHGASALSVGLSESELLDLLETPASFVDRRNVFLDHLLARFAESFSDYAMMLQLSVGSDQEAGELLIEDKINFLRNIPAMTANRARSFNYREPHQVCGSDNLAGLERRIRVLLGMEGESNTAVDADKLFIVEHILLRPRNRPSAVFPTGDPLLTVCLPTECVFCGAQDPYSFRLTIVLSGTRGLANEGIEFRRFAERTIRQEVPAHLAVKICWVSDEQLEHFETLYCAWLQELSADPPRELPLHQKLVQLMKELTELKNVYPSATLHDCVDGDDENRIYLNNTSI